MMALRFEIQERSKRKPTAEVERALHMFQELQVCACQGPTVQVSSLGFTHWDLSLTNHK